MAHECTDTNFKGKKLKPSAPNVLRHIERSSTNANTKSKTDFSGSMAKFYAVATYSCKGLWPVYETFNGATVECLQKMFKEVTGEPAPEGKQAEDLWGDIPADFIGYNLFGLLNKKMSDEEQFDCVYFLAYSFIVNGVKVVNKLDKKKKKKQV